MATDFGNETENNNAEVKQREAIGPIVIGEVNPLGISRAEFSKSPNLLFHGASKDFEFKRDYDYKSSDLPHSHTVGEGFYTTPLREDAVLFSEAFGYVEKPVVLEILPYKARMFDFRDKDNKLLNAKVPLQLLDKYSEYYFKLFNDKWGNYDPTEDREFISSHAPDVMAHNSNQVDAKDFDSYFASVPLPHSKERSERSKRLTNFFDANRYKSVLESMKDQNVDLRDMLSVKGEGRLSEYAGGMFRDFMLGQGYDGVIYTEGGDHPKHKAPVSYVFYNLDKIGTYQTWNPDIKE